MKALRCLLLYLIAPNLLAVAAAAPVRAEEGAERALLLWERGTEAVRRGDLQEAEAAFRQSYEAHPRGRTACDLGCVLRRRSRTDEAAGWLDRCAADLRLPEAEREAARDEARFLRHRQGTLALRGAAEGERLLVDGEYLAARPLDVDLLLAPGEHRIAVVDAQGSQRSFTVEVHGGRRRVLDVSLRPAPRVEPEADRRLVPRWALWSTLALSLASAVGAGIAYGYDLDLSGRAGSEDQADQARLASTVLAAVAGVGLAVTLILIPYLQPRASSDAGARSSRRRAATSVRLAGFPLLLRF